MSDPRLIVALDLPSVNAAQNLIAQLGDAVSFYKIGYRLGLSGGLSLAETLIAQGKQVFLDFKLHDIGNTVGEAVAAASKLGVSFLTVHAYPQTMRAAASVKGDRLKILGVTVLTSWDAADVEEAGFTLSLDELALRRARQALECGIDGVVCAGSEAARMRSLLGPDRLIVTPGIRPLGAAAGDQKRTFTPRAALEAGATHLVIGRPIVQAPDPRAAAEAILAEMEG